MFYFYKPTDCKNSVDTYVQLREKNSIFFFFLNLYKNVLYYSRKTSWEKKLVTGKGRNSFVFKRMLYIIFVYFSGGKKRLTYVSNYI